MTVTYDIQNFYIMAGIIQATCIPQVKTTQVLNIFYYLYAVKTSKLSPQNSVYRHYLFSTLYNKRELAEMHVVWVPNLAILSEYSLHAWCNAAGFAVRHCLPDYLPLCGATFLRRSLIYMIILPMQWRFETSFFKFTIQNRAGQVLKIGFYTIEAYLLLFVHTKFDSCILKNR